MAGNFWLRLNDTVLATTPLTDPPPGVESNLINPENHLFNVSIATYCVCSFLVVTSASVRVFTKFYLMRSFQFEDYLTIFVAIGSIVGFSLGIAILTYGSGLHEWDISVLAMTRIGLLNHIIMLLYFPFVFLARLTVFLSIIRIFAPTKTGAIYRCIQTLIWLNLLFYVLSWFLWLFQCTPLRAAWDPLIDGDYKLDPNILFIVGAGFNIMSDFFTLVLPIYSIWHLKMAVKQKLGVSVVFATGLFALIASIARLVWSLPILTYYDISYTYHQAGLWTVAEMTAIILCASMPTMPRFFQFVMGRNPVKPTYKQYRDTVSSDGDQKSRKKSLSSPRSASDTPTLANNPEHLDRQALIRIPGREQEKQFTPSSTEALTERNGAEEMSMLPRSNIVKTVRIETTRDGQVQQRGDTSKGESFYWV